MTTRQRSRQISRSSIALSIALLFGSCTNSTASETTSTAASITTSTEAESAGSTVAQDRPDDEQASDQSAVEIAFVFDYHQPYLPAIDSEIDLPWARLEAAQNYMDLTQLLSDFDDASATLSMSRSLIQQLETLTNSAGPSRVVDRHYQVTNRPIEELSPDDRQFILNNFFLATSSVIDSFQRWGELRDLRDAGAQLSDADLRDLTVLFHLSNVDAEVLADDQKLASLVERGAAYSDSDARLVLRAIDSQVDLIAKSYLELASEGRLEIVTSPGASASVGPIRLKANTNQALAVAGDFFGTTPQGLTLPGDYGTQTALSAMAAGGAQWVLVSSESVEAPATPPRRLSTPSGPIGLFMADSSLAEEISASYPTQGAAEATENFIEQLGTIAADNQGKNPPLVTVFVDGVGTWQNFENNGRTFLRTLFNAISQNEDITFTTPSKYLRDHPSAVVDVAEVDDYLVSDSSPWQGEPEEVVASELLAEAYLALDSAQQDGVSADALAKASRLIMNAEASDFSYFFGDDYASADDTVYDRAFREWLGRAYDALELERPDELSVPVVSRSMVLPVQTATGPVSINIDGNPSDWAEATLFDFANSGDVITDVGVALDGADLAVRFDGGIESGVQLYLGVPNADTLRETTVAGDELGFGATHLVLWADTEGACIANVLAPDSVVGELPTGCIQVDSALSETGVEMKIALDLLGGLSPGDVVLIRIKSGSSLGPIAGPIYAELPGETG